MPSPILQVEIVAPIPGGGGGTVTQVDTGTGLTGGPITTTGTIDLDNTAVTPGSYTTADITVDAQGRITAAANGSGGGSGTVTSVGTGTGLTGGPITAAGTIDLANTAVTPGSYTNTSLTVDAQGRLTAAASGAAAVYVDYYDAGTTSVGTSPTTLGLDTSRQSNALFVLSSDTVTVQSGGAGDYFIRYDVTFGDSDNSNRMAECWLEVNGTEVTATRSVFSHWDEHGLNTNNTGGRSVVLSLSASDVLRLRGDVTSGSGGYTTETGGVSLQIFSIGANGAQGAAGAQGPPGAGSTVIVQDSGSTVAGGPHSTLNFIGTIAAADAGGGVATVSAVFGADFQQATNVARATSTSSSFVTRTSLTTPTLTGTYMVWWMAVIDASATNRRVEAQLLDVTSSAVVGSAHIHEPKDTRNRVYAGAMFTEIFNGTSKQWDIQYRLEGGGGTAGIAQATVMIWRVG